MTELIAQMEHKKITPSISTLVAELRIIRIGNKQMTQAVFNQLYEGVCFDDEWNVIHQLWGKVLYKDETWIVFQVGDNLRKMNLKKKVKPYILSFENHIKYMPDDIMREGNKWNKLIPLIENKSFLIEDTFNPFSTQGNLRIYNSSYSGKVWSCEHCMQGVIKCLHEAVGEMIWKEIEEEWYAIKQLYEKGMELYKKLESLDQLFIAV